MPPICQLSVDAEAPAAAAADGCAAPEAEADEDDPDQAAARAAAAALAEVSAACDGLGASNEMRQAAETPLMCVAALLQPGAPQGQHALFAAACGEPAALGGGPLSAAEFCALVHMWDTLKLDKLQQGKRGTGYLPAFALALARARCGGATARRLEARLAALGAPGPEISGKSLVGIELLPNHMRGTLMSQVHVLCRLRGEPVPLLSSEQLSAYLGSCGGLLERLVAEWYEEEEAPGKKRQLKPPYQQQKSGRKK